jgi:hypothetical protein
MKKIKLLACCFTIGTLLIQTQTADANTCFERAPQIAQTETNLWKSYYQKKSARPAFQQTLAVRHPKANFTEDFIEGYLEIIKTFQSIPSSADRSTYQKQMTPLLVEYYRALKKELGSDFDPNQAAETYLNWLIQKRKELFTTNTSLVSQLEQHYALLGLDKENAAKMAYLYSSAANYIKFAMSVSGKTTENDWEAVSSMLTEAYQELYKGSDKTDCIG